MTEGVLGQGTEGAGVREVAGVVATLIRGWAAVP